MTLTSVMPGAPNWSLYNFPGQTLTSSHYGVSEPKLRTVIPRRYVVDGSEAGDVSWERLPHKSNVTTGKIAPDRLFEQRKRKYSELRKIYPEKDTWQTNDSLRRRRSSWTAGMSSGSSSSPMSDNTGGKHHDASFRESKPRIQIWDGHTPLLSLRLRFLSFFKGALTPNFNVTLEVVLPVLGIQQFWVTLSIWRNGCVPLLMYWACGKRRKCGRK